LHVPNVSVKIEITSLLGSSLDVRSGAEPVNFNVKAKLEEKERKSRMVVVGFAMLLTAKPSIVRFEVEGTATLTGKDEDIRKMLEVDPERKVPYILARVYQHAFTAMYLLSTILNTPPPPQDLLGSEGQPSPAEDVSVEVKAGKTEPAQTVTAQSEPGKQAPNEAAVASK
jgi:hypothetical protein